MMGRAAGAGAVAHAIRRVGEKEVDGFAWELREDRATAAFGDLVYEALRHGANSRRAGPGPLCDDRDNAEHAGWS